MKKQLSILFAILATFQSAFALDPSHFTINRITSPYFIVDGNNPGVVTRCYIGFEVINSSSFTYTGLKFSIPTATSSIAGTSYNILAPVSRTVNVGSLAPGESKVCYFFIEYPANTIAVGSFNTELSDITPNKKNQLFNIRNRSSISANAGGASTNAFSNQDLLGGILTDTVTYTVGNVRNGDETDFQVAATSSFDPTKLDLIATRVIQSSVPGIPVGATDSLYFISGNGTTGSSIKIVWIFRIVAYNFTTNLLPLAGATSGNTNYKYTLNSSLGSGTPVTISANANPLTIKKYSDAEVYCATGNPTAVFTVEINNPALYDISVQKITDTLPDGFSFVGLESGSSVNSLNAVNYPEAGTTGTLVFEGGVNSVIGTSFIVPAGGSLKLIYLATVPNIPNTDLISGASAFVGTTPIGFTKDTISISCALPVTLSEFSAARQNNQVLLRWTTEREVNTGVFVVQHSTDAANWTDIGTVTAAGNSESRRMYALPHRQPVTGANFYRLKEVSLSGTFSLSHIIRLMFENNGPAIRIYPNPVSGGVMNIESNAGRPIVLMDSKGSIAFTGRINAGTNRISIAHLPKGVYILRSEKESLRIIIE